MKYFFFAIGLGILFVAGIFIPQHVVLGASSTIIDSNIFATITSHNGTTYTDVFVNSSTGYAFYRDSTGACDYAKTTNGGTTWAAPKIVDSQTDCLRIAVWYDQWTPGNTTGTFIHVATIDSGSDDLWYTKLNTTNDATSTVLDISAASQRGRFTAGVTLQSITESTNGTLYAGLYNVQDSYVLKCSSSCASTTTGWTEAGTVTDWGTLANDWMLLVPLPNANILNVRFVIASDLSESKVWNAASSTWGASWATIDSTCPVNTTYDGGFGATINGTNNNIYMDYVCNNATISANTGEIRTQTYFAASSSWTRDANIETSSTLGLTGAKIGLDLNTNNIYAVYTGRTTPGTAATANVYYKISTSTTMSGWGARQGPINATSANIYGARIDGISDSRLYATWADALNGTVLNGNTIAVFSSQTFTEAAYRIFANTDTADVGTPYALTNASSVIPVAGNPFRLRMLIRVSGAGIDITGQSFKLQYATSTAGGCDAAFSGETYVDVGTATSSVLSYYNNPTPANGATLTANGQDPTDGTNVIDNHTYQEQNNFTNSVTKILAGEDGKWDFSLISNSGSSGNTYCFRAVKADGTLLDSYNNVAEAQVDSPPTISGVTLNKNQSIALIEGTTTPINVTATISDANGGTDLYSISGALYRTSSSSSCTADNNDCYIGTGANCSINSCAGNTCDVSCLYKVFYFAQPTDSGTPWAADTWTAMMQASDTVLAGVSATSTSQELLSLLAFETTSTINYGSFSQGQTMATLTASSVIRSSGNTSMNVTVYGSNMTSGSFSIAVGQQHFATSSVAYGSGATLLANPGSTVAIKLAKPSSTAAGMPSSTLFWGIAIPSGQMATTYTGFNSFVGVLNSLPWP